MTRFIFLPIHCLFRIYRESQYVEYKLICTDVIYLLCIGLSGVLVSGDGVLISNIVCCAIICCTDFG